MYTQHDMSYTQLLLDTPDVECVARHMALVINTFRFDTIISTYCLLLFSVCPFLFSFFLFFVLAPCWVCMSVVLWVDVQTGCVWAGVPLSVHLFAALILGFVCSIWAKFSNGDNYRGRPGERRRWVLPFYRVSCMLLQASQLHLPASPSVCPHFSHCVCHHRPSGALSLLSYHAAIHSDGSPSSD